MGRVAHTERGSRVKPLERPFRESHRGGKGSERVSNQISYLGTQARRGSGVVGPSMPLTERGPRGSDTSGHLPLLRASVSLFGYLYKTAVRAQSAG